MIAIPKNIQEELDAPYVLTTTQIAFFQENRFIKLKQVFSAAFLDYFGEALSLQVQKMNTVTIDLEKRDTYGKAFLQLINLWEEDPISKSFVFSKRLGKIAAELMQVDGVRLYHDQALYKEGGGGFTPWHADQFYWPLASEKTVTAWVPLQATPLDMGPLEFSAGSHKIIDLRHLEIGDDSETQIGTRLRVTDFTHVVEAFDLGEISFHSGWVFHRAGANTTDKMRRVMTVIYMDKDMTLKAPTNNYQQNDWNNFCPGATIGHKISSPKNPIIYQN
jgi:ectoine hydroxylase-related dioxygenase (phytanoyl-CoA dioxygenase family)